MSLTAVVYLRREIGVVGRFLPDGTAFRAAKNEAATLLPGRGESLDETECWTQDVARPLTCRGTPTFYERTRPSGWLPAGRVAHSLLVRCLGLSHFESIKHDSNHHANHGENDGPLDEFFLQRFLSKRLMIHLIEHVPIPLSANNGVGSLRDVRIASRNQLQDIR